MRILNTEMLCDALNLDFIGIKIREEHDETSILNKIVTHYKTRKKPTYFYDALEKSKQLEILSRRPEYSHSIVAEAERIMNTDPYLYGYKVDFNNPMVWNFAAYGADLTYGSLINRFEWLIPVGQAYWITNDEKYPKFFLKIIDDWYRANPLTIKQAYVRGMGESGFPWENSLDIGVRLKNLVQLFAYFRAYDGWDTESYIIFLKMILEHSRILYNQQGNLFGGNWQTQECEGLAHAGIMFPEFKEAYQWYDVAQLRFFQHASPLLTKEDGTYHEPTPGYFAWVRSHMYSFLALSKLNDISIEESFEDGIKKMFKWFMNMTLQDGKLPKVGDTSLYDDRVNLALGAALFCDDEMKFVSGFDSLPPEHIWLVSRKQFDDFENLKATKPNNSSVYMKDCQYIVLRDEWRNTESGNSFFFDVNPVALGHNHFDYLNFEAVFDGERLLTECGHLGYGHMFRLKYGVAPISHNILIIDDGELQHKWIKEPLPKVSAYTFSEMYDYAEGKVVYNRGTENEIQWRRSVIYLKPDVFIIADCVKGEGKHKIRRLFHTDRNNKMQIEKSDSCVKITGKKSSCFITYMNEDDISVSNDDGLEQFDGKLDVCILSHTTELPMLTLSAISNANSGNVPKIEKISNEKYIVIYNAECWSIIFKDMEEYTDVEIKKIK